MEINHNPHGLFVMFKRDVTEILLKKVKSYEIDLTIDEVHNYVNGITFKSIDDEFNWISPLDHLLNEETIFELDIAWMKISNP